MTGFSALAWFLCDFSCFTAILLQYSINKLNVSKYLPNLNHPILCKIILRQHIPT